MYWGWIAIPHHMIDDESFWQEMSGVFFPSIDWKETKHTIGETTYILGKSDYFEDYEVAASDKLESPTYEVEFDDLEMFYGFARVPHEV